MWILNLGKPIRIPVLNEQQAINVGAYILTETIIFSILQLIVSVEYMRQAHNEKKRKAKINKEKAKLNNQLQELYALTHEQSTKISELVSLVMKLTEFLEKWEEIPPPCIKSSSHIDEVKSESKTKSKSPPQSNTPIVKNRKKIKKTHSNTSEEDRNNFRKNNGNQNNLSTIAIPKCVFQYLYI